MGLADAVPSSADGQFVLLVVGQLIGEVLGAGPWDSFGDEARRILTQYGPALPGSTSGDGTSSS